MKNILIKIISYVIQPIIMATFQIKYWLFSNQFLFERNNKILGRASFVSIPLIYFVRIISGIRNRIFLPQYIDYGLKVYSGRIVEHYSKSGLGYVGTGEFTDDECKEMFFSLKSRLDYFIINNKKLLNYSDKDSFLDVGCGRGNNLKGLLERYPDSNIKAFDISEDALRVIEKATVKKNNIAVEKGSVTDIEYLSTYTDDSYDHVIISHVLSLIIGAGLEETRNLRKNIIDELVRISKKSLIILDSEKLICNQHMELLIEQKNRCSFYDSLLVNFERHCIAGEIYIMHSDESEALMFFHDV